MNQPVGSESAQAPLMQRRLPAVLVVDDEADLRELLSLTLVRLGLDVDTAESVSAARALLARNAYALCLTDMRLPDGSGLDLVRHVTGSGGLTFFVVVFILLNINMLKYFDDIIGKGLDIFILANCFFFLPSLLFQRQCLWRCFFLH